MRKEVDRGDLRPEELFSLAHLSDLRQQLQPSPNVEARLQERATQNVLRESECIVVSEINGYPQRLLHFADRDVVDHEQPVLHGGPVLIDDDTGETQWVVLMCHREAVVEVLPPTGKT